MKLYNMVGYKLFKEREDGTVHMLRIVGMRRPYKLDANTKDPAEIKVYDYDTKETKKVRVDTLKEYSPLTPDGILTMCIVTIHDSKGKIFKDVLACGTKYINLQYKLTAMPYCVCRQNITDIFYNLMSKTGEQLVGLSVNEDTCPANFDYGLMMASDSVEYYEMVNFYRNDMLEDLYPMIALKKYDEVLKGLFDAHVEATGNPALAFKKEHGGWCRDLKTLLEENNFQADLNQMLGIVQVNFNIADFLEDRTITRNGEELTYQIARDDFRYWLSFTYGYNITEATVLEYDHDINLADFNDNLYFIFRDNTKKLYLITYLTDGKYYEDDLKEKAKELDFSTKFKIDFYNKYNQNNK